MFLNFYRYRHEPFLWLDVGSVEMYSSEQIFCWIEKILISITIVRFTWFTRSNKSINIAQDDCVICLGEEKLHSLPQFGDPDANLVSQCTTNPWPVSRTCFLSNPITESASSIRERVDSFNELYGRTNLRSSNRKYIYEFHSSHIFLFMSVVRPEPRWFFFFSPRRKSSAQKCLIVFRKGLVTKKTFEFSQFLEKWSLDYLSNWSESKKKTIKLAWKYI